MSTGDYSAVNYWEKKDSITFSIRVRVEDLAGIGQYLLSKGFEPKSGSQACANALVILAENLFARGLAVRLPLNEAKKFCEQNGLASGSKRNIRTFGLQEEIINPDMPTKKELELAWRNVQTKRQTAHLRPQPDPQELAKHLEESDESLFSGLKDGKPKMEE